MFPSTAVPTNRNHRQRLGEAIRAFRKQAGMSQEKLAELADLHHNFVGEIERGEKAATIDTLVKMARALDVPLSDLVAGL